MPFYDPLFAVGIAPNLYFIGYAVPHFTITGKTPPLGELKFICETSPPPRLLHLSMRDFSLPLGDELKRTREKLCLSQRKVAEAAGIDTRTVLDIENYRGNPKLEVLYPLVRSTNMDPRAIFFPELLRDSPVLAKLRLLVEQCSEEEAAVMIEVFKTVLNAIRNTNSTDLK